MFSQIRNKPVFILFTNISKEYFDYRRYIFGGRNQTVPLSKHSHDAVRFGFFVCPYRNYLFTLKFITLKGDIFCWCKNVKVNNFLR